MTHRSEVAVAILYQGDQFLLQLRDDHPGILYPGQWGFFGGHLEPGETPLAALQRELKEEISHCPPQLSLFRRYETDQVVRHVFHGPLRVSLADLVLKEGWDLGLWSKTEVVSGHHYSSRAGQLRPIAAPHQAILLSFLEQPPDIFLG
jgi:8-oxo-dGTP pyrophosphatase MutT (NUDIX family)